MDNLCNICNKKYSSYQSLWKHNNKFHNTNSDRVQKIEYKCKICNKIFDNRHKKCYHQKKCKNEIILESSSEKTITNINNKTINTNSHNNINNGTINKTIIINNYNNDNIEYISDKFKERLFKDLLCDEDYHIPLPRLIENIKFNPNHKENHNVKIKSDRSKIGFYYDQHKWKAMNKNTLLDDLCDYSLKILSKYFEEKKESLSKDMIEQFEQFSQIAEIKSELRSKIKDKIENIAYIFTKNNEDELDL